MKAALNYRLTALENLTFFYSDIRNRMFPEYKMEVPMEKKKELNVLLADDDDDDREFFMEVLSEIAPKVKISSVKNGAALMDYIHTVSLNLPDIIFLDLNMPCKNGKECLKEIKKSVHFRHIPIIIYSTSSHVKDIEAAYNEGADLYITKPNTCSELKRIAKKVLEINWSTFILNHRIERFVLK